MKRCIAVLLVHASCLALSGTHEVFAAQGTPAPAPNGQKFLFVVDTSDDMERLKDENEATIYDLIRSGIFGQMQTGDTYALWTFEKETHAGKFPMQVWEARRSTQLATIAAAYLSERNYEKRADPKQMIELLTSVVQTVSNLNVFIISDGGTAMRGTEFDKTINAEYKKKGRERRAAKRPFITTLIARDGEFTTNSVVVAGDPIALPERLPPPEVIARKATPAPNRPAGVLLSNTMVVAPAAAPAAPIVQNLPPLAPAPTNATAAPSPLNAAIKFENVAPRFVQIITRTNSVPAAVEASPAKPDKGAATLASGMPQTDNPASGLSAPLPTPSAVAEAETLPPAEVSSPRSVLVDVLPGPLTVAARERKPEPESANATIPMTVQAAGLPIPPGPGAGLLLAFGSLLMAAALFLLFIVFRRLRPAPGGSLITQSMERH